MKSRIETIGWIILIMLMFGICGTLSAQRSPENDPGIRGLQSITVTPYVFGPLGLPDTSPWDFKPIINRGVVAQFAYPKVIYKVGYEKQEIFRETPVVGMYIKKPRINIDLRYYSTGVPAVSISKSITIFKKSN